MLSVEVGIDGNVYGYQDHMNHEIQEYIATYGEAKILDDIGRLSSVDINKQIEENIIALCEIDLSDGIVISPFKPNFCGITFLSIQPLFYIIPDKLILLNFNCKLFLKLWQTI